MAWNLLLGVFGGLLLGFIVVINSKKALSFVLRVALKNEVSERFKDREKDIAEKKTLIKKLLKDEVQ